MISIKKQPVGNNACVYIVENAPPDFDACLWRAKLESEGRNHKFTGGKYTNMTIKEAVLQDGKGAIYEIYQYIEHAYEPDFRNSLRTALKYFIKADRTNYSLEDIVAFREVFSDEINEYQKRYSINIEAEVAYLDADTKNRIRDYILF